MNINEIKKQLLTALKGLKSSGYHRLESLEMALYFLSDENLCIARSCYHLGCQSGKLYEYANMSSGKYVPYFYSTSGKFGELAAELSLILEKDNQL